jgi:hypothetical protein
MRKQKASDRRTSRRQRGGDDVPLQPSTIITLTRSPMAAVGSWKHKQVETTLGPISSNNNNNNQMTLPTRARSRKRFNHYNALSLYHNKFLNLLTAEYQAEVNT